MKEIDLAVPYCTGSEVLPVGKHVVSDDHAERAVRVGAVKADKPERNKSTGPTGNKANKPTRNK